MDARPGAGRASANRKPATAATASTIQAGQVTCRNPENAMSARVRSGNDCFAWLVDLHDLGHDVDEEGAHHEEGDPHHDGGYTSASEMRPRSCCAPRGSRQAS